jgi:hypothetical protein
VLRYEVQSNKVCILTNSPGIMIPFTYHYPLYQLILLYLPSSLYKYLVCYLMRVDKPGEFLIISVGETDALHCSTYILFPLDITFFEKVTFNYKSEY